MGSMMNAGKDYESGGDTLQCSFDHNKLQTKFARGDLVLFKNILSNQLVN